MACVCSSSLLTGIRRDMDRCVYSFDSLVEH
jgi:hypothetical protein